VSKGSKWEERRGNFVSPETSFQENGVQRKKKGKETSIGDCEEKQRNPFVRGWTGRGEKYVTITWKRRSQKKYEEV